MDRGGKIRSFNIASELARRHEVDLFMFYPSTTPDPHDQLRDRFARVDCVPLDLPKRASVPDTLAYAANAATASQVTPLTPPAQSTNPAGSGAQAAAVSSAVNSNAANSTEALGLAARVHSSICQNRVTIDNISMFVGASNADQAAPSLRD